MLAIVPAITAPEHSGQPLMMISEIICVPLICGWSVAKTSSPVLFLKSRNSFSGDDDWAFQFFGDIFSRGWNARDMKKSNAAVSNHRAVCNFIRNSVRLQTASDEARKVLLLQLAYGLEFLLEIIQSINRTFSILSVNFKKLSSNIGQDQTSKPFAMVRTRAHSRPDVPEHWWPPGISRLKVCEAFIHCS